MAGAGLEGFPVMHQRLYRISGFCPGKFLLVCLLSADDRDGQDFFAKICIEVQHLQRPLLCIFSGGMGSMAFLPEELCGA